MDAVEVLGIDHIDLTVNDLRRSSIFYQTVMVALGFRRIPEDTASHVIVWGNGHMTFAIRRDKVSETKATFDRHRVGLHHLAFKAKSRAAIDEFHRFLVRENLPILDAPAEYPQHGPNYYAVFFADPDGIKLELVHFPWGYWRGTQRDGSGARPRSEQKKS